MGAFDGELAALGYQSRRSAESGPVQDKTFYLMWDGTHGRHSRGRHYKHKSSAIRRYWKEYHAGNRPSIAFKARGFEGGKHL